MAATEFMSCGAGVRKLHDAGGKLDVHALRGTLGTNLAREGVPMATVQKLLRHRNIQTTARYYTHLDLEDLRAGVMKMPPVAPVATGDTIAEMLRRSKRHRVPTSPGTAANGRGLTLDTQGEQKVQAALGGLGRVPGWPAA